MHIKFPAPKSAALTSLGHGESLLIPCNGRTVQSVQSSIQSLYVKKKLVSGEFSQRKALLIIDERMLPIPIILVTRQAEKPGHKSSNEESMMSSGAGQGS